jgi:hypothetical protein
MRQWSLLAQLAAKHTAAHATLLDWANVIECTKDDRLGLRERISFMEGDAFSVTLRFDHRQPHLPPLFPATLLGADASLGPGTETGWAAGDSRLHRRRAPLQMSPSRTCFR